MWPDHEVRKRRAGAPFEARPPEPSDTRLALLGYPLPEVRRDSEGQRQRRDVGFQGVQVPAYRLRVLALLEDGEPVAAGGDKAVGSHGVGGGSAYRCAV